MIVLDSAGTRALSLINTQNGANVEVNFSDYTTTTGVYARGVPTLTTISSGTTTSICATPAASTIRDIDYVNIYNTYAGSQTFTVQITSGSGGPFILVVATLAQSESLNYTHGSGWCAMDANGNRKESTGTVLASLSVTGNATIGGTLGVTGVATFTAQPILSSLTASQAVFTDGSKGLVSNAITGSGNVVMSTSPTFATSVIGGSTMAVFNSASTTVNAFGAATTLNIGNAGGTNTILGATTFSQALTASADITSTSSSGYGEQRIRVSNSEATGFSSFSFRNTGGTAQEYTWTVGGSGSAYPGIAYLYDVTAGAIRISIAPTTGAVTMGATTTAALSATTGTFSGALQALYGTFKRTDDANQYAYAQFSDAAAVGASHLSWAIGKREASNNLSIWTYDGATTSVKVSIDASGMNGVLGATTPAALSATTGTFSGALQALYGTFKRTDDANQYAYAQFSDAAAVGASHLSWAIGKREASNNLSIWTYDGATTSVKVSIDASGMNGVLGATTPAAASVTTLVVSGNSAFGGTLFPSVDWGVGTTTFGANGTDKVITGYLGSATGGAVVAGHNSALTGWAPLYVGGSTVTIRTNGENTAAVFDASYNTTLTGDLAVNGGDLTTSATTFNLINATATTVNFAGAATTLNIGNSGGTNTILGATTFSQATTLSAALTYGGVTLSNAVTGTGNMVLSASPTLTGTAIAAAIAASGLVTAGAGMRTTGVFAANLASSVGMEFDTGAAVFRGWGANAGTVATAKLRLSASDGSGTVYPWYADGSGNFYSIGTAGATPSASVAGFMWGPSNQFYSSCGASTGVETLHRFINGNGLVGSISTSGTATSFNTSSDRDLKIDDGAATATDVLQNIVVRNFRWKVDNKPDTGVFAQEAYAIKPSAVRVGTDEVDSDGRKVMPWAVDYSKFVSDLIVGWKNHDARIKELEARLAALGAA